MAEGYDYERAVEQDVRAWLHDRVEEGTRITDAMFGDIYEQMFVDDGVTGNGSGSYTFNQWKAEENICHNLELLGEACREFDVDGKYLEEHLSGEWADVTIRCYLLPGILDRVVEEWNDRIEEGKDGNETKEESTGERSGVQHEE